MSQLPSGNVGGTKAPSYPWTKTEEGLLLEVMEMLGRDETRPQEYIKRGEIVAQMSRLVKQRNLRGRLFRTKNASVRREAMIRHIPKHLLQARTTTRWTDAEKTLFAEFLDWKKSTPKISWGLFAMHMNETAEARGLNCRRFSGPSCSSHWRLFHRSSFVDAKPHHRLMVQQGLTDSLPREEAAAPLTDAEWTMLTGVSGSMGMENRDYGNSWEDLETQMNQSFGERALAYRDFLAGGLENLHSGIIDLTDEPVVQKIVAPMGV